MVSLMIRRARENPLVGFLINSRFTTNVLLAVGVGIATGYAVVGFVKVIDFFTYLFFERGAEALAFLGRYHVILLPALGALFVGPIILFAPETKGHGVPEVMRAIALKGGRIRPVVVVAKSAASALAIGSGASVGREGPIVQVGSAIGSTVGQWFKLNEARIKNLIACGAAAGISGVFNAPIAGVMFALEVILRDFGARALSTVVIASVSASVISRIYLGDTPAFTVPVYTLWSPYELGLYFVLGMAAGLCALVYVFVLYKFEDGFDAWKFPEWAKPAVGGLLLGGTAFFFPQVFGTGFKTVEQALHGEIELKILAALILVKIMATSVTLGSGNSGGVFAPGLFIGAVLGGTFGKIVYNHMPFPVAPPGAYALVGMASVFAASAHAPVTAILIVFEMTGDYQIILPLMISTVVATIISQALNRESIYTAKLKRTGVDLKIIEETRLLGGLAVRDAMDQTFQIVPRDMPVGEVAERIAQHKGESFFVKDSKGELSGEIVLEELENTILDPTLAAVLADDLARPIPEICFPDDALSEAAKLMLSKNLPHLAVVDHFDQKKVVGVLRRENVFKTYTQVAMRRDELLRRMEQSESLTAGELKEVRFFVPLGSPLVGKKIRDLALPESTVFISIERRQRRLVPRGNTVLEVHDKIRAAMGREKEHEFEEWLRAHHITGAF